MPLLKRPSCQSSPDLSRVESLKSRKPRTKAKSLQVSIEDIIRLRAYESTSSAALLPGPPRDWHLAEREVLLI